MAIISEIRLKNFKSFKSARIPLSPGFNCIIGPNGSGKCVVGDTDVLLADGTLVKIKDLVESALLADSQVMEDGMFSTYNPNRYFVLSLNPYTLKIEKRRISAFIKRKSPDVLYRIKTRSGKELTATSYHPLFTIKNGRIESVNADELRVGMPVVAPRRTPVESASQNSLVEFYKPDIDVDSDACLENEYAYTKDGLVYLLKSLRKTENYNLVSLLANSDIFFDSITSIEQVKGEEWVYDLTVEGLHNFIAEGVFVHNSNICDSIRFLFGESSLSALRARSVNDLINGGGDKASISMKLTNLVNKNMIETNGKNNEGNGTVEIVRKLKKNGGTAYWLNGKRVTKSVVLDFLASEGLEASSHNVIAQGEVEKIVRFTPKQRREVIDEVAGVAEYEEKKKEALNELSKVDQRLNEAAVVMNEREGVLQELEKEKDTALKYLSLKDEQRKLKGTIVLTQYQKLEKEFENTVKKLTEIQSTLADIEKQLHDYQNSLQSLEAKKSDIANKIASKDQRNIYSEVDDLRNKKMLNESLILEKDAVLQRLTSQIAGLLEEKKDIDSKLSTFTGSKRAAAARAVELKKLIENLEQQKKKVALEWEEKRKNFGTFDVKFDELRKKELRLKEELAKLNAKLDVSSGNKDESKIVNELKQIKQSIEKANSELDSLFKREKEINSIVRELDSKILEMKEDLASARGSGNAIPQSIAFILSLKDEIPGIYGTVAELYEVDKKFAIATEAAAGQRLFHIVVQDMETATKIIKRMKQSNVGRATFIPLDVKTGEKAPEQKGTLGSVLNLIKYDKKFANVFLYVFGNTHVVNSVDDFKSFPGLRMVTLDGDIAESSGVVSGGTSIKRSIRDTLKSNQLEKDLNDAKKLRETYLSQLYSIGEQMSILRKQIARDEIRKKELEIELGSVSSEDLNEIRRQISEKELDLQDLEREILNLEGEKARIRIAIEQGEGEKEIARLDNEIKSYSNELAALEEKLKSQDSILLEERLSALNSSLDQLQKEKKEIESALSELNAKLKQITKQLEAKEEKIKDASKELEKLYAESKQIQDEMDMINQERGKLLRRQERAKEDKIRLEVSKESIQTRLADLKVEADQYKDVEPLQMKREEIDKRLGEVELELAGIGSVNLKAPETYNEKLEEFKQIKQKVDILVNEKNSILSMIDEIEKRKKEIFLKTFVEVNNHFQKMAKSLFGSEAYLVLENEANPFEGGLHIVMKVGKKQRQIEGMSGGEKSLLTIAFVFAIHMYKPSKFYILDEVEAALDKENSKRFAELVKMLSKDTQFIVVSHNDTVITSADTALGVTRTKLGSKILSIKLVTDGGEGSKIVSEEIKEPEDQDNESGKENDEENEEDSDDF
jgi:chromosome segregation protein